MRTAPDGSPVELYGRLAARTHECLLIHGELPPAARVLDLGCGPGRLAEPLAARGHRVTGVDNEPAMLAALRLATPVCADIAALDLGRRFDAVLLMSHFVDTADDAFVAAMLATVRRHVAPTGFAVVERHPPGWAMSVTGSTREVEGVRYTLCDLVRDGETLTATIRYEFDGFSTEQRFSVRDVDDARLADLAARAGLRVERTLDDVGTLVLLRSEAD